MRLVVAQCNLLVGDIEGNTEKVLTLAQEACTRYAADLVIFPEMTLTGYPPEDLLLRPSLNARVREALEKLQQDTPLPLLLGYPAIRQGRRVNVAGFIAPGKTPVEYCKQSLPNYRVFDEKRYFQPGEETQLVELAGIKLGLSICEDVWHAAPTEAARAAGAELLLSINASPFRQGKHAERLQVLADRARENHLPIVYCNLVGGQDELVFDGGSLAMSDVGEVQAQAPFFGECLWPLEIRREATGCVISGASSPVPTEEAATWQALVLALRDYVHKNGFEKVVLGLSGGIDSALVLALAVEALGAARVMAVMMPYHYTATMSLEDAAAEASTLGVDYRVLPIATAVESFNALLTPLFSGMPKDTTEENLQARCRGVLLMAISNKHRALVLPTGNKSETAVGYCTLYGDMVGGFAVLKDVSKTWVYRLARWRNAQPDGPIIPERVITRPPSAELAPGQVDQDSLPDYAVLDRILACYVEQDMSAEATIRAGFERDLVYRVVQLVDRNEYKRRQAAPGPRITQRAFGKDRRYPVTNGWRPGD